MKDIVQIKNNKAFIDNNCVYDGKAYNLRASDDDYEVVGLHGCNPNCYEYLEKALVVKKATKEYVIVNLWNSIGCRPWTISSKLKKIYKDNDGFYAASDIKTAKIYVDLIFADDVKIGDVISPKLDINKAETCFDYEICEDYDVLMTLKPEVPRSQMLRWKGFDMSYDTFKFSGSFIAYGQAELLFCDSKTGNSWSVSYGHSTTMTSDEVWKRRDKLRECMCAIIPNHPKIRESMYVTAA